jgi:hypothetical protein
MVLLRPGRWQLTFLLNIIWSHGIAAAIAPAAEDRPPAPEVRLSAIRPSVGGLYSYVPGKWSVLGITVSNPDDEPREILSATYFDGAPTVQYGRQVWIPARSRLRTWSPVLVPQAVADREPNFPFHSLIFDAERAGDVLSREGSGQLLHSGVVPARLERPVTGFLSASTPETDPARDSAYDLVVAARTNARVSRRLTFFAGHERSPDEFSLQPLDQLVIVSGDLIHDAGGIVAVRRWVHSGGRLWVMVDRTGPLLLERILGDEFTCQVIDRVSLTSVRIESTKRNRSARPVDSEFEVPVDLMRIVPDGNKLDVELTVNGWPAALWIPFGAGRVLVTTLDARAWMRDRRVEDELLGGSRPRRAPRAEELDHSSQFVPLPVMSDLGNMFLQFPNLADSELAATLDRHAAEYIGYSIPPRWLIMGTLSALAVGIVVIGSWLWRKCAIEHLAWISPALALAATGALLTIGVQNRHAIPAMAAAVGYCEAYLGTDDLASRGALAFYSPEAGPWTIATRQGGVVQPDMSGLEGTARRLVWSDLDVCRWQNLTQISPQRSATYVQAHESSERIEARGAFGPDGVSGRLAVPESLGISDMVLVTRTGQMGVTRTDADQFRVPADGVLARDQFLDASILSDEQYRRQRTCRSIITEFRRDDWTDTARLLMWTERNFGGFEFGADRKLMGTSLLSVPVRFERPPAGTVARIASPFLPYRGTVGPDGVQSSPLWDRRKLIWHEHAGPAAIWLSFHLPPGLAPIQLSGGQLTVQVAGPLGILEVKGQRRLAASREGGGPNFVAVSLKRWDDPVGTLTLPVTDSSVLEADADGDIVFGFSIAGRPDRDQIGGGDAESDSKVSYWRIEDVSLELTGKILEAGESSPARGK